MGGGTYTSDVHCCPVALGLLGTRLPMAKRGQGKANNEAAERVARQVGQLRRPIKPHAANMLAHAAPLQLVALFCRYLIHAGKGFTLGRTHRSACTLAVGVAAQAIDLAEQQGQVSSWLASTQNRSPVAA